MLAFIIIYLLLINAAGFSLMLADKHKARKKLWRIPEATLLTVAAIGGSAGSLLGMKLAHHKTLHLKFVILVPLFLTIHVILAIWIMAHF